MGLIFNRGTSRGYPKLALKTMRMPSQHSSLPSKEWQLTITRLTWKHTSQSNTYTQGSSRNHIQRWSTKGLGLAPHPYQALPTKSIPKMTKNQFVLREISVGEDLYSTTCSLITIRLSHPLTWSLSLTNKLSKPSSQPLLPQLLTN